MRRSQNEVFDQFEEHESLFNVTAIRKQQRRFFLQANHNPRIGSRPVCWLLLGPA